MPEMFWMTTFLWCELTFGSRMLKNVCESVSRRIIPSEARNLALETKEIRDSSLRSE